MLVVASTNGQNGELKAARTSGWRASSSSRRLVPYLNANRLRKVIGSPGLAGSNALSPFHRA